MHIQPAYEHGSTRDVIRLLGISLSTFYRWLKSGVLVEVFRTAGGHRRFDLNELKAMFMNSELEQNRVVIYSRVSSHDQKNDLIRQEEKLAAYCKSKQFQNVTSISDLGSGLNYKKAGLTKLFKMILHNEIDILIINHKDRLLRFGSELIFMLCQHHHVKVFILEDNVLDFEEELTHNVIELMTVFCAKLYGRRSHKNRMNNVT